ncbi:MAG: endonuclease/exonuclease/phosphatase family protein [Marinilabiliales bacterium]|nr:endonuclease/exonuclease/phosphatase family protein [Marinilabiliales bacterium]
MKKNVLLLALILGHLLMFAQSNPLRIATYNLRYDNPQDGDNVWQNRKEALRSLIRFHDFDLFGTQEGLIHQLKEIAQPGDLAFTGHGREDGKEAGEHSAIFYKKDRFELLDSGDFWLSETPDKPSLGWDATCCSRICSWGKFRDKQDGKRFYFFSVHFDHQGVEARRQSGILMVKKIRMIAGDTPAICVGDFNSTPDTEQIQTMQGLLSDARQITLQPPYGPEGTFNSFKFAQPEASRIDYIFLSKGIRVDQYGVLTDSYQARYPSDHFPVTAKIILP